MSSFAAALAVVAMASSAAGQSPPSAASATTADALFEAGKQLRESGQVAEACSRFAQSQGIAPGIGVTLYLADCFERLGRPGNAWIEFRYAETLALARHDPRVEVARTREQALEARVGRVAFEGLPADVAGSKLEVDGVVVPPELWHQDLVVDPGDHSISFTTAGNAPSRQSAHVHAAERVTVRLGNAVAEPASSTSTEEEDASEDEAPEVAPAAGAVPAAKIEPAAKTGPAAVPQANPDDGRRWVTLGLLGAGVASIAVGAGLLVVKNDSWSNGTTTSGPRVDPVAAAASKIAFATGGAAVVAAVVFYLATPHAASSAVVVAPVPLIGGGGAVVGATF